MHNAYGYVDITDMFKYGDTGVDWKKGTRSRIAQEMYGKVFVK